ncbi:MAG: hypothetical protein H7240_03975 [Glaciimonas sp.]|nr:hypothetical protein [Glaciimonas sp.]
MGATLAAVGMTVLGMTGCADFAAINAQGVQDRARILGSTQTGGYAMATQSEQSKPAQVTIPKDKRVAAAIEEALPTIKKVLAIHQCVQNWEALRQLNLFAVPGVNMAQMGGMTPELRYPDNEISMKFHNRNKCVGVTTLDQWGMLALNALQFRAVYFADDSGETISFLYLFKKMDDGSWKLAQFNLP